MAGVRRIYGATALTGVGTGSLSSINSIDLKAGDLAIAQANSTGGPDHASEFDGIYFYRYASVSTVPDSTPRVIKPNNLTNIQVGRWLLISPTWFMENLVVEPGAKVVTNEIIGNDGDLQIEYNDGTVYITVGDNIVTIDAPTLFTQQLSSSVVTGTAPFSVASTTVCPNLNAGRIGGKLINQISLVDGTQKYSGMPGVVNNGVDPTISPVNTWDLVTKKHLDDVLAGSGTISHSSLTNLTGPADDHTQYANLNGTRPFTAVIGGVTPTANAHLTTKLYVDTATTAITNVYVTKDGTIRFTGMPGVTDSGGTPDITPTAQYHLATKAYVDGVTGGNIDHGTVSGLIDDDHTQYILVNGTRAFTGVVSGIAPTSDLHLSTKKYVDDEIIGVTDVYIVKDGTIAFTGIPQITNTAGTPDFAPTLAYHIATKAYVDGVATGGTIDHGGLLGLADDDHTQYILVNGTRDFTGKQIGVAPTTITADPTGELTVLVTKGWVKTELNTADVISHSNLADLTGDDHTQYILADSSREFDVTGSFFPSVSNNGVDPDAVPTQSWELATKDYVDTGIATLGDLELFDYVSVFGNHDLVDNQNYITKTPQSYFNINQDSQIPTKGYTDTYLGKVLLSTVDEKFGFFTDKLLLTDDAATVLTSGTVNGIAIEKTSVRLGGGLSNVVTHGGSGFFVDDTSAGGWTPQTFTGLWDAASEDGAQSITETDVTITSDIGTDDDLRIAAVKGDIEYMEIIDGGTGLVGTGGDGWYTVSIAGNGSTVATWEAYLDTGVITALRRDTTATNSGVGVDYTYASNITSIIGITGAVDLKPYIVGSIASFYIDTNGSGYTSASYTYKGSGASGGPVDESYVWSGAGISTGAVTILTNLIEAVAVDGSDGDYTITDSSGVAGDDLQVDFNVASGVVTINSIVAGGTGYSPGDAVSFDLSGIAGGSTGTMTADVAAVAGTPDSTLIDVTFYNDIDEKVKFKHYSPLTTPGTLFDDGYTRTTGQVISGITFDSWGHIREITEAGVGGSTWVMVDETNDALVLTANTNYFALTDTSAFELRMPATPTLGMTVIIDDYGKNSSVNNITVNDDAGATLLVEGSSATAMVIDVDGSRTEFVYVDGTYGWRYTVI